MPYATPADIRPLIGNLSATQRTDSQVQLAIDSATTEINQKTNHPLGWSDSDPNIATVKKLARYIAALESSVGLKDFEDRKLMQEEVDRLFTSLTEYDTDSTTDIVSSSEPVTWPMNPNGLIYSTRYPKLKGSSGGDNSMYSVTNDLSGW